MKGFIEGVRRWLRIAKALVKDQRVPKWVRGLLIIGLLPIPGPFDELIAVVGLVVVAAFYRPILADIIRIEREGVTA